ncbi:Stf0 family sulfotransferase [Mesorhizobium sp. B3-2-1]|uniref:Stf0 family sulfotransferase n=1 Tax=Mesorhizobium sp. B3-2-1 TaxID=2589891 RepID=UPI001FED2E05|nr:Stf0 family sulfotransferase [Mesorhizobium sp. B3-2-1]
MFDGYIICGTPRTGSTLLCKLLAATGTTADPHSFYRRQDVSEWAEDWGLPLATRWASLNSSLPISMRQSLPGRVALKSSACA